MERNNEQGRKVIASLKKSGNYLFPGESQRLESSAFQRDFQAIMERAKKRPSRPQKSVFIVSVQRL